MPPFIPGLQLSEGFYHEAVRPLLDRHFPGLRHAACRIGFGSETLGFDTEMSRDHEWGPSVDLLLDSADHARWASEIDRVMARELPREFLGYGTHFGDHVEPDGRITGRLETAPDGVPIKHRVRIEAFDSFFRHYLNLDLAESVTPADWLTFPAQHLRTIASGRVYHDDLGLNAVRARLAWYPHDVWLYLLMAGWARIGQEEHLMPRAGYAGDELGSSLIGSRLARDIMRQCFLMERQYAPYPKWYGTAFQRLACAPRFTPHLWEAVRAETWQAREKHLGVVYEALAAMHNDLGIIPPMPATVSPFFGRPFQIIWGGLFAEAVQAAITDPEVRRIAEKTPIGGIDQWIDSTDGLNPRLRMTLRAVYE